MAEQLIFNFFDNIVLYLDPIKKLFARRMVEESTA